ncbi:hypothetical protein LEP1GSC050_3769 [Leptospira broomii serovar Hurstbridge str. 5399]|uniref:Uncharacterized protein n=1 Tax=Leptospira broomii serovar Hurstbridge str. 5399 TaxID=1049789 RepID=T0GGM9_9LEPT|nr:hypothetical protein LEP1GSC050_3769 [Leptospira broomii serovar Hurstbridge str. 5399]
MKLLEIFYVIGRGDSNRSVLVGKFGGSWNSGIIPLSSSEVA